jgi:hypothetical protein
MVIVRPHAPPLFSGLGSALPAPEGATLSWSAAFTGPMTYSIYESMLSGAEDFNAPVMTTTNLTAFVSPLTPGITYYFVVRATDNCGVSESNTVERSVHPSPAANADSDGDGIPDSWELQYFGCATCSDPNADSDGDGMSNLMEYMAGTNPTNSASVFAITAIARESNDLRVTWTTGIGKTNALQCVVPTARTFTNDYMDIFIVTNTVGTVTNYLDPGAATNTVHHYRVRLVP